MENLELYEKFRIVPEEAKKKIGGGRLNGMTDINPMWRIKKLTETFGACGFGWWYEITSQRIEDGSDNQKAAFVDIKLFVKYNDTVSQPIYGIGGSMFITNEKNGAYTSDECFKMALTDAIGNACKSLGIGADVYFEKDRTKYDLNQHQNNAKDFLNNAIKEVNEATTEEILLPLWTKFKDLTTITEFKTAFNNKRAAFYSISKKLIECAGSIENLNKIVDTLPEAHKKYFEKTIEDLKTKLK